MIPTMNELIHFGTSWYAWIFELQTNVMKGKKYASNDESN